MDELTAEELQQIAAICVADNQADADFDADVEAARLLSLQQAPIATGVVEAQRRDFLYPSADPFGAATASAAPAARARLHPQPQPQCQSSNSNSGKNFLHEARLNWLRHQARTSVVEFTGCSPQTADSLLDATNGNVEAAISRALNDGGATGSAAQGGGGGKLHAEAHMPSVVPDPFLSAQKHSLPEVRHHAPQTKDEEEVLLQLALQLSRPAQENKASDTADAFAYEGEVFQDEDEECMGCGAEHDDWEPASRIFQYGCGDHWMCLSCTKDQVDSQLEAKQAPHCPACKHNVPKHDVLKLFGRFKAQQRLHLLDEILMNTYLLQHREKGSIVQCPSCPAMMEIPDPGRPRCVACPNCALEFCTHCKAAPFHFRLTCMEIAPTTQTFHQWLSRDRAAYFKRFKDMELAESKFKAETQAAQERAKESERDELWKAKNCKLCPHCKKVVHKVDGCDSMTCGRDADDKGGGNKQNGCGQRFRWNTAPPYEPGADTRFLPPSFEQALANFEQQKQSLGATVTDTLHYVTQDELNAAVIHAMAAESPGGFGDVPGGVDASAGLPCQVKCRTTSILSCFDGC
eukprot:INCI7186.4.p1 GENE.INCI7186.4~~INCI7186.4.p1  ORF type:complete len:576 (+),score=95.25 INCI7186.4:291-2018(+)